MRRITLLSLFMMLCCANSALLQAAPAGNAKQGTASLSPNDPGYVEEDPALAKHVGQPAPVLTLKTIDGKTINLANLYGKRPVYLKLWATYCIPCRVQMPDLKRIFASYGDKMSIVAVNAGVGDDIGKVRKFAKDYDLKMPVAIDDGRLGAWIGLNATPISLVFGRDGRVIFAGHQDGPKLNAAIERAVASKAAPGDVATDVLADADKLKPGDAIPAIALHSSNGKAVTLPRGPAPHLRAIYFSATWCESYMKIPQPEEAARCEKGRQLVDKLAADQSITWFGVMTRLWTTPKDLAAYEAETKPRLPLAVDTSGTAFRKFGIERFPAVAFIDTKGQLVKVVDGNAANVSKAISSLQARK